YKPVTGRNVRKLEVSLRVANAFAGNAFLFLALRKLRNAASFHDRKHLVEKRGAGHKEYLLASAGDHAPAVLPHECLAGKIGVALPHVGAVIFDVERIHHCHWRRWSK